MKENEYGNVTEVANLILETALNIFDEILIEYRIHSEKFFVEVLIFKSWYIILDYS